jgi:ATP-binding protein involved in chromosome partitioning
MTGAVIVTTPQDIALIDARKAVTMFEKVGVPILGVIENMSWFVAPDTGIRYDIFGHGGARDAAASLGLPFLGEVPLVMSIRETSDAGRPVVAASPEGPESQAFRAIVRRLRADVPELAG